MFTDLLQLYVLYHQNLPTDGFRTAAPSKMELFLIIVNGFQLLTIIIKCSILDGAAVLDPPLLPIMNEIDILKFSVVN